MKYGYLDDSGLKISRLGFGVMRLPTVNGDYSKIDIPRAESLIDLAYKSGVNYFDVAYNYHKGNAEGFIGKILSKYPRDSYFLADKLPLNECETEGDIDRVFNEQLERCNVDYFDFYLVHGMNQKVFERFEELGVYRYLLKYRCDGRIKRIGFSFHDTPEVLDRITDYYRFDFAQIQLNYFDWVYQDAKKSYEILYSKNIPIIAMEPVRGGFLHNLPDNITNGSKIKVDASLALRWVSDHSQVLTVLSGMSTVEQVLDNVEVIGEGEIISNDEQLAIDNVVNNLLNQSVIHCTSCNYCVSKCDKGVAIPKIFSIYNKYLDNLDNKYLASQHHNMTAINKCVSCRKCCEICPQHIDIPDKLNMIKKMCKG